jgi:small-conductance mechanosensitive channel
MLQTAQLGQSRPALPPEPAGAASAGPPEPALQKIEGWIEGFYELLPNIGVALVVFVLMLLLGSGAKWLVRRWARRRRRENLGDVLGSFLKWTLAGVGLLIVAAIVLPSVRPVDLLAGFGIGSIAFGFAFKDILQNWLAGLLLLFREPFRVGDQVIVGPHEGTVERIETRSTNIRTYDGRRVLIPNSNVYTQAVTINTAFTTRRNEYLLGIGYGDDIGRARDVILGALRDVEGVERDPGPLVLPWALDPSWVTLKIWWWTHSRRVDVVLIRARVIETLKHALDDAGIDMPFPTAVQLWHDQTEAVDGVRGRQREGWPRQPGCVPPLPARHTGQGDGPAGSDGA